MSASLKEHGLTMPKLGAPHVPRAEGAQSVSAIAEHVDLSRTATSHLVERLVERLVRENLVQRQEDPNDRRQKRHAFQSARHHAVTELDAASPEAPA